MTSTEDNRLPDTKELEGFVDVKVRPAIRKLGIKEIGIPAVGARPGIHAVSPGKLRFSREGMRELVFEPGEHHVVARLTLLPKVFTPFTRGFCGAPMICPRALAS